MARPLCSACKRRPASYLRSASGKPLCTTCLARSLERAIKRSLRGLGVLERGSTLIVAPSSLNPYGLHVTLSLLRPSAKAAGARIIAISPRECRDAAEVEPSVEPGELNALDTLRLERAYAAEAARSLGAPAALLPVDATTLSSLGLEALLSGRLDYMIDVASRVFTVRGVRVAYSLASVEAEAIAAYAALAGLPECSPPWRPHFAFHSVFKTATRGRGPELLYGGLAAARQLSESISGGGRTSCRSCGAPGYEGLCPTCSRLNLDGLRLLRRS